MRWFALIAAAALGQSAPAQPPVTFRAGVEIVRLDVRVTDTDGRPVKDLRPDEIEIIEDGEPRPIVHFQHIEEPSESFAEIASRTVAAEVSTNKGAARGHLYVIVFDQLHLTPGNEQRARLAAQRFVTTGLRPGDRVALYALPGPGPQIGFTTDARRIASALADVRGTAEATEFGAISSMSRYEAFEILRGNETILQRVTDRVQAQRGSDAQRRNDPSSFTTGTLPMTVLVKEDARKIADTADGETRAVLAQLADVLRPFRAIEGRKSILLVSEGFQSDRLSREVEDVAAAAAESYSVVYALDVNRRQIDITNAEPVGADQAAGIHDNLSPLGSLAAETGGALIIDAGQRAEQAFASLAERTEDYYLVGFAPPERALNQRGVYRRVTVRVRRSGARVSTRTGFALTDAAARMDRQQSIQRALAAPFPQQGLPLRYTTYVLRGSAPGIQRVIVSLETELPVASAQERQPADVVFVVRSATDGHVATSGRDAIALPTRTDANATTGTAAFRVQFELQAGDYLMRALVREPGGLVGAADRRFTVRALDGPSIESGDLVLASDPRQLPVRPVAYTGDGLTGALELYARTVEQLREARVTIELAPLGEPSAVVSGVAELLDVRTTDRGVTREARIELPLESIAPGTYLARARVTIGPDTVSQTLREVDVRLGRRASLSADGTGITSAAEGADAEFDPHEIATSAVARDLLARLAHTASGPLADARTGIDRLGAADYPSAIAAFTAVLAADSRNAPAAFFLGWAYHGAGQDRQAISAWRRAAYVDPTFVPAHLALAEMYVRIAQPALAAQALRAGLAALPGSPELAERLARLERTKF